MAFVKVTYVNPSALERLKMSARMTIGRNLEVDALALLRNKKDDRVEGDGTTYEMLNFNKDTKNSASHPRGKM
jgi:hypothetical protein